MDETPDGTTGLAVAVGEATVEAEHAAETAEEAQDTAEAAHDIAEAAVEIAIDTAGDNYVWREELEQRIATAEMHLALMESAIAEMRESQSTSPTEHVDGGAESSETDHVVVTVEPQEPPKPKSQNERHAPPVNRGVTLPRRR